MEKMALGLIETVGLAAALEAADAAVKSANVALVGYELTKGGGLVTIKLEGDVGAVNAAVQAGCAAAEKVNRVYSRKVIPRPHDEIRPIIRSNETVRGGSAELAEVTQEAGAAESGRTIEPKAEDLAEPEEAAAPIETTEQIEIAEPPAVKKKTVPTCNLCNDIKCTREKGDLKMKCIHYFDK